MDDPWAPPIQRDERNRALDQPQGEEARAADAGRLGLAVTTPAEQATAQRSASGELWTDLMLLGMSVRRARGVDFVRFSVVKAGLDKIRSKLGRVKFNPKFLVKSIKSEAYLNQLAAARGAAQIYVTANDGSVSVIDRPPAREFRGRFDGAENVVLTVLSCSAAAGQSRDEAL